MTYIDRLKYEEFGSNMHQHFKKAEVINFDIINHRWRGDSLQNSEKVYKAKKRKDLEDFLKLEKKKTLSTANRTTRSDLWNQRDLIIEHLKALSWLIFTFLFFRFNF